MADKLKPQCVGFYKYHDVVLGKGNFATVYLARHKVIGCEVALKVINTDDIEEEYVSRNLTREARILRDLHHPNIIRLYETVKSVNLYCLSLELIRGVNLYQYMMKQESRKISEKLARIFFYQMLSAVKYMHHLHVIHRDLKLENILVEFGHIIKIVDFGLSNVYYPCYRLRTHCGSVEYAAPELFRSMSAYGSAADLWSLGVILYAMVVGKMPFMFSRDKLESSESARKRELFVQRISKGLMQENWERMEDLSPDCWNLLHDLLQPDQFRRIRIEDAIAHHWITKDEHLKKRLPQNRKDLQRKFHPEVVDYLAHKLNTSTTRIEKHINVHPNDKIACMFYIVRDLLVKEVLHPPKEFESSFLYRFECWRQSRPSLRQNTRFYENKVRDECDHLDEAEETTSPKSVSPNDKKVPSISNIDKKVSEESELSTCLKRMDLQKPSEKSSKKVCRIFNTEDVDSVDNKNNEDQSNRQKKLSRNPYRSYKNSRPENAKTSIFQDKVISKQSGLKQDVKRKFPKEKLYENEQQFSQSPEERSSELHKDKNRPSIKPHEESSRKSNRELKSQTITKLKSSENVEERKFGLAKTQIKHSSSIRGITDLKKSKYHKTKIEDRRITKKLDPPESVTRQIGENRISLLKRAQKSTDDLKKKGEVAKMGQTETSSRIPVKNVRYGPPAPFSQPVNSDAPMKPRRTTVAERINLCRGDTRETLS